jgi:hypothetical protein
VQNWASPRESETKGRRSKIWPSAKIDDKSVACPPRCKAGDLHFREIWGTQVLPSLGVVTAKEFADEELGSTLLSVLSIYFTEYLSIQTINYELRAMLQVSLGQGHPPAPVLKSLHSTY